MFPLRRIAGFFVRLLVFYGLLMVPWPGVDRVYAAYFRAGGNLVLGSFGSEGKVLFLPTGEDAPASHTDAMLTNRTTGSWRVSTYPNRYLGYAPTAALVSLVLATPVPWSRRWRALLWGLLLVHGFVVVRVALPLLKEFSEDNTLRQYSLSPFWRDVLDQVILILVTSPTSVFVAPIIIWVLVTFRRGDLEQWMPTRRGGPDAHGRGSHESEDQAVRARDRGL
ncbi:MAG: hypothetical protein JXQ75_17695 [Phycisphaerae bacterium]|nr:hypothetical protein [Phycisphaerae bacterium]